MPAAELVTVVAAVPTVDDVNVPLVIVGVVAKTLFPVPVEAFHEVTVPLENNTVFAPPIDVRPVPLRALAMSICRRANRPTECMISE